ncbi:MAG: diguanylate cyclase [Oscillospiraceae bacterium]
MKNKTLIRTNILVCLIITIGFVFTSVISYNSNKGQFEEDIEQVATLTQDGIYNDIAAIFSEPVSVSVTMANDSLLKDFLTQEKKESVDEKYIQKMQDFLGSYKEKYEYDSVFLVSAASNRYYHFDGLDRVLTKDNPENVWYYDFLKSDEEYSLNVDNDEATKENTITVFVNCKIKDDNGSVMGVVGVGLKVNSLQELFRKYESEYAIKAYLVDKFGTIQISSDKTGYEKTNLFDTASYKSSKARILDEQNEKQKFWYYDDKSSGYVVSRFEPNLKWHLIVENDTTALLKQLNTQLLKNLITIVAIIALVLVTITAVIKKYNAQIIKLTVSQELEYQRLLHETTAGLYENIFEFDITNNRAGGESTKQFFKSYGMSPDAPYDKALEVIAQKQIKDEYIKGYLDMFAPGNIMKTYESGITNLTYDFMITQDGESYHWIRLTARIFFWNSDKSVRMITYRENVDSQKRRELELIDEVQKDAMTGLYNKGATEALISQILQDDMQNEVCHAFLILDIDNFKTVNDTMGHSFGDDVIRELASEIDTQFHEGDIVGRIGGDEFVVLIKNVSETDKLKNKLERVCSKLGYKNFGGKTEYHITCSIGVAIFKKDGLKYAELYEKADQALYYAKGHGKAAFSIFGEDTNVRTTQISQRDTEKLLNEATDGIAKFACTTPLTLLYFNEKFMSLTGNEARSLSAQGVDPFIVVHPDDIKNLEDTLSRALKSKEVFSARFRLRHKDGHYFKVKVQCAFADEMYKNKYPVLYVMYVKKD